LSKKLLLLAKQTQVHAEKRRYAGTNVKQEMHEKKQNAASNLCWPSVQAPCRIV